MDQLYWLPNWDEPNDPQFFAKLDKVLVQEAWVMDGNYSRTTALKWAKVHKVIWLDYGFCRTFYQSLRRAITRIVTKQELWSGPGQRILASLQSLGIISAN